MYKLLCAGKGKSPVLLAAAGYYSNSIIVLDLSVNA